MFSKTSKGSGKESISTSNDTPAVPSIISSDLRVVGDINSEGEVQIDGVVEGDIRTNVLLVGETATIKGEIVADTVHVHGTVNGQIKARSVDLAKSAHVVGDILHEDLSIEAGAFLEGLCKRITIKKDEEENKINLVIKEPGKPEPSPDNNDAPPKSVITSA